MSSVRHPNEGDLALLAGAETTRVQRFLLDRHVRNCSDCQEKVTGYRGLRDDLSEVDLPGVNWNFLASEMRANIRVGIEAGACVRTSPASARWAFGSAASWASAGPRIVVAFATLVLLVVSGFYVRDIRTRSAAAPALADSTTVLQSTSSGVEIRTRDTSLMLSSRPGNAADQTVSASGDIGARVIDAGSVTINNVYLLQ